MCQLALLQSLLVLVSCCCWSIGIEYASRLSHEPTRNVLSKSHHTKQHREEQIWAGKGHKQKGASGQTALVAQKAKITDKGQTQVAQWQRLPSQLLQEYCQRQKRPNPKYKNLQKKQGSAAAADYKYRVIVCDAKGDDDKDLFFVPAQAVPNEEQAKEEGALLALLQLTPTLPHERKLPEPYKTTWLNAMEALKNKKDRATASSKRTAAAAAPNDNPSGKTSSSGGNNSSNNNNGGGGTSAVASSNLTLGRTATLAGGMSKADRRRQQDEQRRQRNTRIRKHDAIRMANQNHPVFMSRLIREQIESLLRGGEAGVSALNLENGDDDDDDDNIHDGGGDDPAAEDDDDDAKVYVEHRLHSEGFTKRQARSATRELSQTSNKFEQASDNEDLWDDLYEECLQWLLVHLNEDQLPEGFDPRGRMLDVIVSSASASTAAGTSETCAGGGDESGAGTSAAERAGSMDLAARLGIMFKEASLISNLAAKENRSPLDVFWRTIQRTAGMEPENSNAALSAADEATIDLMKDELEALEAIFPSECAVTASGGVTAIRLPLNDGALTLEVVVQDGLYPSSPPSRVTVSGTWPSRVGAALHVELSKFLGDLPLGEPMVFAIHAHVQDLLLSEELSDRLSLLPHLGADEQQTRTELKESSGSIKPKAQDSTSSVNHMPAPLNVSLPQRRPRARGRNFWSTRPQETPPAVAFPQVGAAMERTRKSLPAASSRDEFLAAMKRAENGGRVLLVTGETGSGRCRHYMRRSNARKHRILQSFVVV